MKIIPTVILFEGIISRTNFVHFECVKLQKSQFTCSGQYDGGKANRENSAVFREENPTTNSDLASILSERHISRYSIQCDSRKNLHLPPLLFSVEIA